MRVIERENDKAIRLAGAEDLFSDFIGALDGLVSHAEDTDAPYKEKDHE
jgi:hypothetical protein